MEKPSVTFIPEQLDTCGAPILQENISKNVKQSAASDHLL